MDIACAIGTPIAVAHGGRQVFLGTMPFYGNVAIVTHGPYRELYAHLSAYYGKVGRIVGNNTVIGRCGSTGHSTGPHLHFEVYFKDHVYNPMLFLPPTPRA
ncbi:MAG: M23 family metallopeptidase [Actinobacteria bacterium]|nr:M23 family metallopeptidase [Actinomycetota bacterium]